MYSIGWKINFYCYWAYDSAAILSKLRDECKKYGKIDENRKKNVWHLDYSHDSIAILYRYYYDIIVIYLQVFEN